VKQIFGNTVCTRGFAWLSTLIFQKSSRIYPGATSIQDTTLVGTDLVAMFQEGGWAAMSFMTLSALAGGITVLISLIGAWSLIGLTVLILMLCITVTIARVGRRFMSRQLKESDNRLSITKEVIAGIKPIKMQGWEYEMHKSVSTARSKETSYLRLFRLCMVVNMSLGRASPILGTCSTFVVMAAFGVEMTLANALAAVTCFQALRMPLIMIPMQVTNLMSLFERMSRIQRFLETPEKTGRKLLPEGSPNAVEFLNASVRWNVFDDVQTGPNSASHGTASTDANVEKREEFRLSNVNLVVPRGKMVAVVGQVGSGKTSLLLSILNELELLSGDINSIKSCSYVAQKAFVMSGTVQDNITMGCAVDDSRLNSVIAASSLSRDLEILSDGLQTEIGERGATLSGGQQQRLAIARGLYTNPELLLMDDPLAAVDTAVCKSIFEEGILPFVRASQDRSCIMALNQLALLPRFDHIVFLKNNTIAEQGTFEELQASGKEFSTMIANFKEEQSVDDVAPTSDEPLEKDKPEASNSSCNDHSAGSTTITAPKNLTAKPRMCLYGRNLQQRGSTKPVNYGGF